MESSRKETLKIDSAHKYRQRARHWSGKVPVCVVYPNTYYLGMSNLGFQTIYHFFTSDDRFAVDRLFYPDSIKGNVLRSHETEHKLNEFYVLAFSVSYENDMLNVLKILKAGGIQLKRRERGNKFPLLIAGGAAITLNPGALYEVFDAFFIGECEDAFNELADAIVRGYEKVKTREHLVRELSEIEGFYIPEFYNYEYNNQGRIIGINSSPDVPARVRRRITTDINRFVPRTFIFTPSTEFKNMGVIEISRGCRWRCRFCAASYIYHPVRFRSAEVLKDELLKMSGFCNKIGLLGALPTDHPELEEITDFLLADNKKFSFSSIRVGSLDSKIIKKLKEGGERTITLAPETGTERLRKIINKHITNNAIFSQIDRIVKNGIRRIKLYFLIGLPYETDDDVHGISELVFKLKKAFPECFFTLSVGIFVPKPYTPFQWNGMAPLEIIQERIGILKNEFSHNRGLSLEISPVKTVLLEALLSHADPRLSAKIIELVNNGSINRLLKVVDYSQYIFRKNPEEFLPWDVIDGGIERSVLLSDYRCANVINHL
jgi:radical SAM superfamily enzyme YgiQ (UPF0313 family)